LGREKQKIEEGKREIEKKGETPARASEAGGLFRSEGRTQGRIGGK